MSHRTTIRCHFYGESKTTKAGKPYQVLQPVPLVGAHGFEIPNRHGELSYYDAIIDSARVAIYNFGPAVPADDFHTFCNKQEKAGYTQQQLLAVYDVEVEANDRGFLQLVRATEITPASVDAWPEPKFEGGMFEKVGKRMEWRRQVEAAVKAGKTSLD
jgi:hypothetical protein